MPIVRVRANVSFNNVCAVSSRGNSAPIKITLENAPLNVEVDIGGKSVFASAKRVGLCDVVVECLAPR